MAAGKTAKKKTTASGAKQPAVKKAATKKTGRGKAGATARATKAKSATKAAANAPAAAAPAPKCVIILRGLPGAGKSTRAEQLAAAARAAGCSAAVHSTDSFFTDPRTGQYRFSFSMLHHNHKRNFKAFCSSLQQSVHTVIVDNTNILRQYYQHYKEEAHEHGYEVKLEVVGEFTRREAAMYAARNVHGVPYEKVMQMLEQWWEEEVEGGCSDDSYSDDEFDSEYGYSDGY